MKKILKYLFWFIAIYVITYLFAPGGSNGNEYNAEFYWLEILICELVICLIIVYFNKLNPRKHIMIYVEKNKRITIIRPIIAALCFFVLIALGILIAIKVPDTLIKILLAVLWLLTFPTIYYILFFRGITIYKNKKIRFFNFKVTTYQNGLIEEVKVENFQNFSKLIIVINGKENIFWVSSRSAQSYKEKILKVISS